MTQVIVQYDSIVPSQIPSNAVAVAGYVGGNWPDYSILVQRFPLARHKSVAVNAFEDADILDTENGDAVPEQAPSWFRRQKARGLKLPGVYADASTMPSVVAQLEAAGITRSEYVMWVAHVEAEPVPPFEQGADAVQWTFNALGRDLDQSQCLPSFWGTPVVHPKPITNKVNYAWFEPQFFPSKWGKLNERQVVQAYDKARVHPFVNTIKLRKLRAQLDFLAKRVAFVAKQDKVKGKPSWGLYHRGWRYQQLIHRAQGQRFV